MCYSLDTYFFKKGGTSILQNTSRFNLLWLRRIVLCVTAAELLLYSWLRNHGRLAWNHSASRVHNIFVAIGSL
jgi:hypothetical protein